MSSTVLASLWRVQNYKAKALMLALVLTALCCSDRRRRRYPSGVASKKLSRRDQTPVKCALKSRFDLIDTGMPVL
jgi:hypothetical protein